MHEVEDWPTDVTVAEPDALLSINGEQRKLVDLSLTKSLGAPLSGSDGLIATTGDANIVVESDTVTGRQLMPWSPLMPKAGESVTVEAGYAGALAHQFQGIVDGAAGGVDRDVSLQLVDDFDQLDRSVTLDPLMAVMPPYADTMPYRYVGVTPTHVTSTLLRECGFYATPPWRNGVIVSAPMNGSMWAERGEVRECSRLGDADALPLFERAPWGQAAKQVTAKYSPSPTANVGTGSFELSCVVGNPGTSGSDLIVAYWGNDFVRLRVFPSRAVDATLRIGSTETVVCSLSASQMDGAEHVVLRVGVNGSWRLYNDVGQESTGTRSFPKRVEPSSVDVVVPADGAQIAGVQAGWYGGSPAPFVRTADLQPAAYAHSLEAMPSIIREKASDVLRRQARAELAYIWLTDRGVVKWRNRYDMAATPVVRTVTSNRDILDLEWVAPPRATAQRLVVKNRRPVTSRAPRSTITVYEGRADSLDSSQRRSEVVEVPSDEDWIMPDLSAEWLDQTADRLPGFNRGRRTWVGMVKVNGTGSDKVETWISGSDIELGKIDPKTFVWDMRAPGLAGTETAETRAHRDDEIIWSQWRGIGFPLIRAYGKASWLDEETVRGSGVEQTWDASWFVQHPTGVNGLANYLENQLFEPRTTLRDMPIIPDTRLELGDIIIVDETHRYEINMRCLITGIKVSASEGQLDQSLTLQILDINGRTATYEELERAWTSGAYTGFENEWSGEHYSHFENNPTRRG